MSLDWEAQRGFPGPWPGLLGCKRVLWVLRDQKDFRDRLAAGEAELMWSEKGTSAARGLGHGSRAFSPSVLAYFPATGDPDPHLRLHGHARVVRGDARPAPGARHHGAGQQQHGVHAGRGLPCLQGGVLVLPHRCTYPTPQPQSATVLRITASEINQVHMPLWPRFLLPTGG